VLPHRHSVSQVPACQVAGTAPLRLKTSPPRQTLAKIAHQDIVHVTSSGEHVMEFETLLLLVPILYVALQWSALRRMRDGWRWAAAIPVVAMLAALAVFVVGIVTNASMAPMWLVLGLPLATIYLVLLLPLHWIVARDG
jgi:hypothetical protein